MSVAVYLCWSDAGCQSDTVTGGSLTNTSSAVGNTQKFPGLNSKYPLYQKLSTERMMSLQTTAHVRL
jgi:hypothetical protein